MTHFTERHANKIAFGLSCFDRVVISGSLVDVGYAQAMTSRLNRLGIRLFDYPKWADAFRLELRDHAEAVAKEHGLAIEFIQKRTFRKEERIRSIVKRRGGAGSHFLGDGVVHGLQALARQKNP